MAARRAPPSDWPTRAAVGGATSGAAAAAVGLSVRSGHDGAQLRAAARLLLRLLGPRGHRRPLVRAQGAEPRVSRGPGGIAGAEGPGLTVLTPVSPQGDHHDAGHHRRVLLPLVSTANRAPIPPLPHPPRGLTGPGGCCPASCPGTNQAAPGLRPASLPGTSLLGAAVPLPNPLRQQHPGVLVPDPVLLGLMADWVPFQLAHRHPGPGQPPLRAAAEERDHLVRALPLGVRSPWEPAPGDTPPPPKSSP